MMTVVQGVPLHIVQYTYFFKGIVLSVQRLLVDYVVGRVGSVSEAGGPSDVEMRGGGGGRWWYEVHISLRGVVVFYGGSW